MISHSQLAGAIRALSMDAVEKANSGHPGMPLGMADIATVLWRRFLKHNPLNPCWPNRDRFVLSNGHGSMLLYALLHLSGYALSMDELKQFRQLNSATPGHPEFGHTLGVETTTGPLGQGLANAVGLALAEKMLAAQFNRPNFSLIDHFTYVFMGDGCLMEGISHEACSLAGTWQLGKLIAFYDDNGISIDGKIHQWFTDNTAQRFAAYDWHVIDNIDGHDPEAIAKAIKLAQANQRQPSILICKTHIGYGAPNLQDSEKSHGAPFGQAEIQATKEKLGWPHEAFEIPDEIYKQWDGSQKGQEDEQNWQQLFNDYQQQFPQQAADLRRRLAGEFPADFAQRLQTMISTFQANPTKEATRKSSERCLNMFAPYLSELVGGSADLTGSNNTKWREAIVVSPNSISGNYIHYGVREFGMAAIMNGLALHGGFIPFGGTFLVFSDYARNAIRLSAMMKQKVIYVLSHDSIGLGEDGPTHQPVEHITMLRATPGLDVWRPADAAETAVAWQSALFHQGPSCLLLSRQALPALARNESQLDAVHQGGYILQDADSFPEVILLATGSEVSLAIEAAACLTAKGRQVRVVSMPCMERFLKQTTAYQQSVLPPQCSIRVAIEAGAPDSWYRFTGLRGAVIGLEEFGKSAPYQEVYGALKLTVNRIIEQVETLLASYYAG